jgi:hypothetical protein
MLGGALANVPPVRGLRRANSSRATWNAGTQRYFNAEVGN